MRLGLALGVLPPKTYCHVSREVGARKPFVDGKACAPLPGRFAMGHLPTMCEVTLSYNKSAGRWSTSTDEVEADYDGGEIADAIAPEMCEAVLNSCLCLVCGGTAPLHIPPKGRRKGEHRESLGFCLMPQGALGQLTFTNCARHKPTN